MTTLHESIEQAWIPAEESPKAERKNMNDRDRAIAGATGGLLVLNTLRRPSLRSVLMGAAGTVFLRWAASGHCGVYKSLGIDTAHRGKARPRDFYERGLRAEAAYTVQKSPEELYQFWRRFENLPRFMRHLQSVTVIDDTTSHWVAIGPADSCVEWDARIINEEPNRLIAWRSLPEAQVDNAGSVRFLPLPGDRGTEVRVVIEYMPPGGKIGAALARLFGRNPQQQVEEDLRRFKQIMEAGEVPTVEGQPRGTCGQAD